jgi:uncharacterized RDD family membrane protein YckC
MDPQPGHGGVAVKGMLAWIDRALYRVMRWMTLASLVVLLLFLTAVVFVRFVPILSMGWSDELVELGKKIFKIRVVTVEGLPISMNKALLRAFATILSQLTLGIGYLMAGLRSDKRALHDLLVKTCVVRL